MSQPAIDPRFEFNAPTFYSEDLQNEDNMPTDDFFGLQIRNAMRCPVFKDLMIPPSEISRASNE